jgi:hypothetical protein
MLVALILHFVDCSVDEFQNPSNLMADIKLSHSYLEITHIPFSVFFLSTPTIEDQVVVISWVIFPKAICYQEKRNLLENFCHHN